MSDASEHLAPVSYLPWATPAEPVPERSAPADRARSAEGAHSAEGSDPDDGADPDEGADSDEEPRRVEPPRAGRSRFGDPSEASRRAERRRARFAIVADDPDETGPERDARIDRLVVSGLVVRRFRSPRFVRCSRSTGSTKVRSRSRSSATSASATSTMRAGRTGGAQDGARRGRAAARSCGREAVGAWIPARPRRGRWARPRGRARNALEVAERRRVSSLGSTGRPPTTAVRVPAAARPSG